MQRVLIRNLSEGMRLSGTVLRCFFCQELFVGRSDSQYCSERCRHRARR